MMDKNTMNIVQVLMAEVNEVQGALVESGQFMQLLRNDQQTLADAIGNLGMLVQYIMIKQGIPVPIPNDPESWEEVHNVTKKWAEEHMKLDETLESSEDGLENVDKKVH